MEDISSLIWLGLGIVWFLMRFIRRGAKKVGEAQKRQPRPNIPHESVPDTGAPGTLIESQSGFSGRVGKGPPPIVPR